MSTMNNSAIVESAAWTVDFCARYAPSALNLAQAFLIVALLLGVLGGIVVLILALRRPPNDTESGGAVGGAFTAFVNAIKTAVESFAKAPVWLAMFGAGAILLWMAGNAVPAFCVPATDRQQQSTETPHDTDPNASTNTTADGNDAEGRADDPEVGGGRT